MSTRETETDAVVHGKYHFLDVGSQKYGDCMLVEFGALRVLIDGSHEKDFEGQQGFDSTPEQLAQIFGTSQTPHKINLLVVTHCHQDHIGALPKLVSQGVIKPKWALVTDHKLGFGRTDDDSDSENRADLADERTRALAGLLREEDASDLSDSELKEFMDGAATVESKYLAMLKDLRAKQVKVIEYRGQALPQALLDEMKSSGMKLLGPSRDQLVLAAAQIARTNEDAVDAVRDAMRDAVLDDVTVSTIDIYRRILARDAQDRATAAGRDTDAGGNARGNGMNCQSLTLAFGPEGSRALLAGDMQFADPGVKDADDEVANLRMAVRDHGPYKLFKTTHHTSHNGQDDDILGDLGNPPIIVHTGGRNDPSHPFPGTLGILKRRSRDIVFARTDRNGLITVEPHRDPEEAVAISKGRVNDFTDNVRDVVAEQISSTAAVVPVARRLEPAPGAPQIIIVNLPNGPVDIQVAGVNILVREQGGPVIVAGNDQSRVPRPSPATTRGPTDLDIRIADGRQLPKLLFVTNSEKLVANIGGDEARSVIAAISRSKHALLDVTRRPDGAMSDVQTRLRQEPAISGVVILGGYDVVPSVIVDVLPAALRATLGSDVTENDGDDFVVWSDEPYGDMDGDRIAERPVSRVPDGRDSTLFLKAIQAKGVTPENRYGIRNIERPFAVSVWSEVHGNRDLNASREFLSRQVASTDTASGSHYFMLHGSEDDATMFSGEDGAQYTRAFAIDKVPRTFNGIVFSGCCWGALTVSQKAIELGSKAPAPRVAERSIALAYLKAGANAFVGCTGSHYSGPDSEPEINYALPFHAAFWKTFPRVDHSAALALYGARKAYGSQIAEGNPEWEPIDIARRLKNRAQFTCLGLGW